MKQLPSKPMSEGERSALAHDDTHFQNGCSLCGLNQYLHLFQKSPSLNIVCRILSVSRKKNPSISDCVMIPRHSDCVPSSMKSFGDGVAVQSNLYGSLEKNLTTCFRLLPSNALIALDSSATAPTKS